MPDLTREPYAICSRWREWCTDGRHFDEKMPDCRYDEYVDGMEAPRVNMELMCPECGGQAEIYFVAV